jgi:hypothetical protein
LKGHNLTSQNSLQNENVQHLLNRIRNKEKQASDNPHPVTYQSINKQQPHHSIHHLFLVMMTLQCNNNINNNLDNNNMHVVPPGH